MYVYIFYKGNLRYEIQNWCEGSILIPLYIPTLWHLFLSHFQFSLWCSTAANNTAIICFPGRTGKWVKKNKKASSPVSLVLSTAPNVY